MSARGARREVEEHDVSRRYVAHAPDPRPAVDDAAELDEQAGERVGDRVRATVRDRPAMTVAGGGGGHPDR